MDFPKPIAIEGKNCVDILICKILVWDAEPGPIEVADPDESKCLVIRECESIEIKDTYKQLISTASVRFPRGTIIQRTITGAANDTKADGTTTVYTERLEDGLITEKRKGYSTAQPTDFSTGQRIRIYLGYYKDRGKVFKDNKERIRVMESEGFVKHVPDFDGYITKCSVSTPIELRCENLASGLKRRNVRNTPPHTEQTVNVFFEEGKGYDFLKGTGLKLHPDTQRSHISVGQVQLSEDMTIADVLSLWSKYKLYCFIRRGADGVPYLKIGRSYFASVGKESLVNTEGSSDVAQIQFDYHVAEDNLTTLHVDPHFLAVSAESFELKNHKQIKHSITVRLSPEWGGDSDTEHDKYQILNETKLSSMASKFAASATSKIDDRINLSAYTIIPYTASKIGISRDDLIKEAQACFEDYSMNGVEGSLTIFGDKHQTNLGQRHLESGMKVFLLDSRHPERQGCYLIEEIHTKFGVHGFRQTLKLPYCISKPGTKKINK